MTSTFERYHEAASRLNALIDMTPPQADTSREAVRERAGARMQRLVRFLERLGNPHQGYPIIHVGGTSGKGSTSTAIAAIMTEAGYRTGLHTSPYLQTPLEKLQLDGKLIDASIFVSLVDDVLAEHKRWLDDGEDPLTYGEVWNALTWLFFRHVQVDVAIAEVGAGGRFDLTNIISPVLSVITSVGIDHTHTLGSTIEDIAWHKAGIIKPGIPALTTVPNPVARQIIIDEAVAERAPLTVVDLNREIVDAVTSPEGTVWRERGTGLTHRMGMCGTFQARNGQTAVSAVRMLDQAGIRVPTEAIERGLLHARIPGRAELVAGDVPVLLDGAHNPEKIAALADDINALLPVPGGARRVGILGLLDAKKGDEMIRSLLPVVDVLIATVPKVLGKDPKSVEAIVDLARQAGFAGEVLIEEDSRQAIRLARAHVDHARGDVILVTGSLYLVGNVREQWYSEREIVIQRTPWPVEPERPANDTGRGPTTTASMGFTA